jgi:hypothetical protein
MIEFVYTRRLNSNVLIFPNVPDSSTREDITGARHSDENLPICEFPSWSVAQSYD